jgi:hypothetical protein
MEFGHLCINYSLNIFVEPFLIEENAVKVKVSSIKKSYTAPPQYPASPAYKPKCRID